MERTTRPSSPKVEEDGSLTALKVSVLSARDDKAAREAMAAQQEKTDDPDCRTL